MTEKEQAKLAQSGAVYHHTASQRGYLSRKGDSRILKPYEGKFGKGFVVLSPRWDSSRFIDKTYYIFSK